MNFLWLINGMCLMIVLLSLWKWNEQRKNSLKWWQWSIIGGWGILLMVSSGFIGTALGEGEPRAAMIGGTIFVLTTVISGIMLWRMFFGIKTTQSEVNTKSLKQ